MPPTRAWSLHTVPCTATRSRWRKPLLRNFLHRAYIIADIFKYRGLIIGSPTYSNQIYPEIESLLSKILVREVKGRYLGYFGSFCWAGAAVKRMGEFAEKSKFEIVGDPVEMKQAMKDITYEQCENLARAMAERLKKDRK